MVPQFYEDLKGLHKTFCGTTRRRLSGVFNVNFEQILQIVLVFLLLILDKQMPVG